MSLSSTSYSQVFSFELDTIQLFKCPSYLTPNDAVKLNQFEYYELVGCKKNTWMIDINEKKLKVGSREGIKIIKFDFDLNERWVFVEFLGKNNKIHKLAIGAEKGTNKDVIIVTRLEDDMIKQRGYFGYPTNFRVSK